MASDRLLAFALTASVLIAIPGPSVLFTISRALTIGRRGALLTVLGNAAGGYLQVVGVACGLGELVERSVELFTVLKLVGAAYLIFLGIHAIRHRRSLSDALATRPASTRAGRVLADGFMVGIANPKTVVFFLAVLPQFVDRGAGRLTLQLLLLGAIFYAVALVCDSLWAIAAGSARIWLARSPSRPAAIGGAGGVAMIGIGVSLALTGRRN